MFYLFALFSNYLCYSYVNLGIATDFGGRGDEF